MRGRTGLTATLVVALGAAAFAPSAWADGSVPAPPPTPVAGEVDAGDVVDVEALVAEVESAVSEVSSEPAAALVASDTAGDTAPDITDSAQESGNTTASAQATAPVSVQIDPANLNVNVRIDSPGDDGAVSQSNTTVAATQPTAAPARSSTGGTAQPATKAPTTTKPTSGGTSQQASPTTPSASAEPPGTWQWTWDCVSPPNVQAPVLRDADGELLTWNWTWIWNCDENVESASPGTPQYQSATENDTTARYQPGNVNIAIRISSPGNNGPVSQTNVAVSVGVPTPSQADGHAAATSVHLDVQVPGVADALPFPASAVSIAATSAVAEALDDLERLIDGLGVPADEVKPLVAIPAATSTAAWLPAGPCGDVGRGMRRQPGSVRGELWSQRCLERPLGIAPCRCLPPGPPKAMNGTPSPIWATAAPSGSSARAEATRLSKANRAKPTLNRPTQRIPTPTGVSGAALGAAPAGSSSGGTLPVSLLIPLVVGFLDLCRRIAVTKVTLPTGLRGGTFDPPG